MVPLIIISTSPEASPGPVTVIVIDSSTLPPAVVIVIEELYLDTLKDVEFDDWPNMLSPR